MQSELITTSTAGSPLGNSPGRKLLRVADGSYANRLVLLYQDTPGSISLRYADAPYTTWSAAQSVATDTADSAFDCMLDLNGDVLLAYTAATTFDMQFKRLAFSSGAWTAGAVVTVYNVDDCYFPSIIAEPTGRIWITYTRVSSGSSYINAIKSDDAGATWGIGAGEELAGPDSSAYSQIVIAGGQLYVFYTLGGTKLAQRNKLFVVATFSSEVSLASGSGFDEHFHAAVAADNRLGVAFDDGAMRYREFDGSQWATVQTLDSSGGEYPRVVFTDNNPSVVYLQNFGANQVRLLQVARQGGAFQAATDVLRQWKQFEAVALFSQNAGTYADLTTEAGSSATGDVFHPTSNATLAAVGDAIYCGHSVQFNYLKAILATAGVGGSVDWQYFDGAGWVTFTPSNGTWDLETTSREMLLWNDSAAMPADWQMTAINGVTLFYVRAIVSAGFTTNPVASQLTAIANLSQFISEG